MEPISKMTSPAKDSHGPGSKPKNPKSVSENSNPNSSHSGSARKVSKSPLIKSGTTKSQKPASRIVNPVFESPKRKLRERKFVVAKRKANKSNGVSGVGCKCKENNGRKCVCVAYENLRASQEEFFKGGEGGGVDPEETRLNEEIEKKLIMQDVEVDDDEYKGKSELVEGGVSVVKRTRERIIEEVRKSVPEAGKVMSLVQAFENILSIRKEDPESKDEDGIKKEDVKPEQSGLEQFSTMDSKVKESLSSFLPPKGPELVMTSENLGLNTCASVSASWDSSLGSISSRTSNGSRRNRRHSTDSTGAKVGRRLKKKHPRVTSLKPFELRTEQRGKMKEEEFIKKLQEMIIEQERQRVPIAQGLPWTTDEPECLVKPPVKESTLPIDLKLHTDVRAVERSEFDHQVAEKMSLIEQYKKERERQQQLEEEEEIRRLRKELVPKAQPMPYFDRPFIPKRAAKLPTIPREPKFHIPEHKKIKCCLSWNDSFSFYQ